MAKHRVTDGALMDTGLVLLPEYRIEAIWQDDQLISVERADDKLVLSQQFLDDAAMGNAPSGVTLDVRPCECGLRCFHGAILTIDPKYGDRLRYRLTEQIEFRTVWWAERAAEEPLVASAPLAGGFVHHPTVTIPNGGFFGETELS